jgi:MFS family permease
LIIYINSSFLDDLFSETQVSALYMVGSIISTILLLNASKILEKIGIYKFIVYSIIIEFWAIFGLAASDTKLFVGICFLTHLATITFLLFNMDVLVESVSNDESITGSIRATYLTLTNITILTAPVLLTFILVDNKYSYIYFLSSLMLLPLYYSIEKFKKVKSAKIHHIKLRETIIEYTKNKDLYNIFISHFFLQIFYACMVIYTPIYLEKYIGFSWSEIGIIFTIMLLPFVIFELPAGELADEKYGEKEFLTVGFIIMGLSTLFISFITLKSIWIWSVVLFITRVGASLVEVSTESYFFKHVDQEKTDVISFFRVSRPLSFIVAPLLATLVFQFIPFQYIFIIVGGVMITGAHYSLSLRDTK